MYPISIISMALATACGPAEEGGRQGPPIGRDGRGLGGGAPGCRHGACDAGDPLLPSCEPCAATVCALDPYCCQVAWDAICVGEAEKSCNMSCTAATCDHGLCEQGSALAPSCDACAADICSADPFCCTNGWDSICIAEVATVCGQSCKAPAPPCAHDLCDSGDALDPACDPCTAAICGADPFCCDVQWDRVCVREVDTVCGQSCQGMPPPPPPVAAVDILFVVDSSCSMADEQANLSANFQALLAHAQSQNLDYQIAVTTMDVSPNGEQGAFVGATPIITPSTPNPGQVFASNVDVGTNGAPFEQGLEATYLALSGGGPNPGFLRSGANLVVVYLSDEDDQSQNTAQFYETFLLALKQPPASVTVNAIIGTTPSTPGCYSDPGVRYEGLVNATNGVAVSVCASDWSPALTNF